MCIRDRPGSTRAGPGIRRWSPSLVVSHVVATVRPADGVHLLALGPVVQVISDALPGSVRLSDDPVIAAKVRPVRCAMHCEPHILAAVGVTVMRVAGAADVGRPALAVRLEVGYQLGHRQVVGGDAHLSPCLLYTSDAADERSSVDLGG